MCKETYFSTAAFLPSEKGCGEQCTQLMCREGVDDASNSLILNRQPEEIRTW